MSIFFDLDVHEAVKRYAKTKAMMSVSTLVNEIVRKAMIDVGELIDTDGKTVAELVAKNYDFLLKNSAIPKVTLDQVKRGAKPDEITLLRIHGALQIPEGELRKIVDKTNFESKQLGLLENTPKGLKRTNGDI